MKVYLEADLSEPDERDKFVRMMNVDKAFRALTDILEYFRADNEDVPIEESLCEVVTGIITDCGIDLDEMYR